jgi:hypothetical protein
MCLRGSGVAGLLLSCCCWEALPLLLYHPCWMYRAWLYTGVQGVSSSSYLIGSSGHVALLCAPRSSPFGPALRPVPRVSTPLYRDGPHRPQHSSADFIHLLPDMGRYGSIAAHLCSTGGGGIQALDPTTPRGLDPVGTYSILDERVGDNALTEIADPDCREAAVNRQLHPFTWLVSSVARKARPPQFTHDDPSPLIDVARPFSYESNATFRKAFKRVGGGATPVNTSSGLGLF